MSSNDGAEAPAKVSSPVRLTSLSHGAGCACKVRSADLAAVLRALPVPVPDPRILVGLDPPDDAAVVKLTDELALVFTTDFFTPVVDDPYDFGRIAATNAISDVYAMGGTPLVALNITAFPSKTLPLEVLGAILRGGNDVAQAAGIRIAGGHSIDDAEPKYGLAVVGTVHPQRVWTKGGARAGDALVLTKALGTGVLSTALKRDRLREDSAPLRAMVSSMTTLNAGAAEAARASGVAVHAATDVTGFGLVGHLLEVLRGSAGVGAEIDTGALRFLPEARALAEEGVIPGGTRGNREHAGERLVLGEGVPDALAWLACDAQTSGGLLFSVSEGDAAVLVRELHARGLEHANVVGRVVSSEAPRVVLR